MHAHYLQHVPFEGLGSIESWLTAHGYTLTSSQLYESPILPSAEAIKSIDLLIIMGGPMSIHDEKEYPWLAAEKQLVRHCIDAGKAVLGICLGAQIIAHTLGASVFQNKEKEIGWLPINNNLDSNLDTVLDTYQNIDIFNFPPSALVFHWHGETFDIPSGAVQLARSEGCAHQAFQYGRRTIGLQFHLETTPESAQAIVSHCRNELVESQYIQSEDTILSAPSHYYAYINSLMAEVLNFLHCSIDGKNS